MLTKFKNLRQYTYPLRDQRVWQGVLFVILCCTSVGLFAFQSFSSSQQSAQSSIPVKAEATPTAPADGQDTPEPSKETNIVPTDSSAKSQSSSYRSFVCKDNVIPYQTEYRSNDSMAAGETKILYEGKNGYVTSCTADSNGYVPSMNGMRVEAVNSVVYKGTGLDAQREQQANEELAARNHQYALNLARCISGLKAQGVSSSTADRMCRGSVQY